MLHPSPPPITTTSHAGQADIANEVEIKEAEWFGGGCLINVENMALNQ